MDGPQDSTGYDHSVDGGEQSTILSQVEDVAEYDADYESSPASDSSGEPDASDEMDEQDKGVDRRGIGELPPGHDYIGTSKHKPLSSSPSMPVGGSAGISDQEISDASFSSSERHPCTYCGIPFNPENMYDECPSSSKGHRHEVTYGMENGSSGSSQDSSTTNRLLGTGERFAGDDIASDVRWSDEWCT